MYQITFVAGTPTDPQLGNRGKGKGVRGGRGREGKEGGTGEGRSVPTAKAVDFGMCRPELQQCNSSHSFSSEWCYSKHEHH